MNIQKCLLAVDVYEFTGDDIGKLRKVYNHDRYLTSILPKYTFNKEYGNIVDADGYLQFIDEGDERFILFNLETLDPLLKEEISNSGLDSLLKESNIRSYIEKMNIKNAEQFQRSLTSLEYLIIEIEYTGGGSYFGYADDFDVHVGVVGALVGNNLELITIQ